MTQSADSPVFRRPILVLAGAVGITVGVALAVAVLLGPRATTMSDEPGVNGAAAASPTPDVSSSAGAAAAGTAPTATPSATGAASGPPLQLPPIGSSVVSVASPFASCTAGGPKAPGPQGRGPRPAAQTNSEVEPSVAVDPGDPLRMVAAWQQDRWTNAASRAIGIAATTDGGRTWHRSWPPFSACEGATGGPGGVIVRVSDPWVTATADGTFLVTALGVNADAQLSAVLVSRSTDGGLSWSAPVRVAQDATPDHFNDKEAVTADPAVPGRAWIVWDRTGGSLEPGEAATPTPRPGPSASPRPFSADVMLIVTNDGGLTWSTPRAIFDGAPNQAMIGNQIATLPDGTLVDVAELLVDSGLRDARTEVAVLRSTDGGTTWSGPIVIATVPGFEVDDPRSGRAIRAGWAIPDIAVDRTSGRVYVTWTDSRFRGGKPGIALASSNDGGLTWSQPARVDAGVPGTAAFTPMIEVARDGTIGLTFDDANTAGAATGPWNATVVLAVSRDGARTWTRRALTPAFDLHAAPNSGGLFLGDYAGLAATGEAGAPAFIAADSVTTARAPADPTDLVVSVAAP